MDIESLRAFVNVVDTGSFSLAAKQLFITQPAVSKRISALESHLNHSLFDRVARQIFLTEAGENLLPRARAILQSISDTERNIRELSGEINGILKVATSHHIGLHHLPPILREFASQHRNVNLQFEFLDSEQANEKILRGACELAIVTIPRHLEPSLKAEILWQDQLSFACGINHSLAKTASITLRDLSKYPAILPDLNTITGKKVKHCFDQADLSLSLNMSTNYLETIKMMVSVGLGWSVLPATMLDNHLTSFQVTNKSEAVSLGRQLGVITHKNRTLGNAARAFYSTLCANIKQNTDLSQITRK
ncbi:MAG: LysR family transcriptional regulator [Cellvibrionaceae bacterium]|nr:LysR family transcriptional regulator [Cellvibrionaceae bacterium]